MVQVQFDPEVEIRVREAAAQHHVSADFLVKQVVLRWLEDQEDYANGIHALAT